MILEIFGFGKKKQNAAPPVDKGPAFRRVFEQSGFIIDDSALAQIPFEPGLPATYEGKVPPDNIIGITTSDGQYTRPDGRIEKYAKGALISRSQHDNKLTVSVNPHTWHRE